MNPAPYTLHDGRLRLIGIPLVSFLVPVLLHFDDFLRFNDDFVYYWVSAIFTTLVGWEGIRYIIIYARQVFPTYQQTSRRLLFTAGLTLAYTLLTSLVLDELICRTLFGREVGFLIGFRMSLMPTMVVYLAYESMYFFSAWEDNIRKTESLARESVQSQLEVLKNQLDPHFLFNSLNTLAALIDDENTHAQQYLESLSDVYRYVLVSRGKNTVPLAEEMKFLEAYVYLNKIRFRDNLLVEKHLSAESQRQFITPLSLQMLVENAIKHNVVSKETPLKISIEQADDGYLVVRNNIQQKPVLEKSTRVGLQNIINRYRLLTDRRVEIINQEGLFTVKLPLLLH